MNDETSPIESLPLDAHEQIGNLREEFEDTCLESQIPAIEAFLDKIDKEYREVLFRELLSLELDYRCRFGQLIEREEYVARFPEYVKLIDKVFEETRAASPAKKSVGDNQLPDDLPQFGPYVAKEEIGRGGFGRVYLAAHEKAGHQVAIKVGEKLLDEARNLASLNHPNIVRVLFVGEDAQSRPYLVMDYMRGGSLRDRLREGHKLSPEQATRIAIEIADALQTAHSHPDQIVHRDLKPENVLFDDEGDDASAYVADFGLALREAEQESHRGDFSGTVPYQSPEQIRGEANWIDGRSDIWALGVILYEMLTGRRPFPSGRDLPEQIQQRSPKSPRSLNSEVSAQLEAICLKCLEKEPKDRYQTADALSRALRGQELGGNPYKGLESFEEGDADRFFGRDEQVKRLESEFTKLYHDSLSDESLPRILPVLGPSGCGKSSLVKAGLMAALRRTHFPNKSETRLEVFRPRTRPLKSLADVLDRFAAGAEDAGVLRSRNYVKAMMEQSESAEHEGLWWIVDSLPKISDSPLILVVDQFEELYTECEDAEERSTFIDNLLYAASRKDGALSVVLTLRSDFLPETHHHERLNDLIARNGVLVPAFKESELREAITKPAHRAGYDLDETVVDLLIKDTKNRDGALPLLQMVLTRIWDGLQSGEEPADTFRSVGGVGGALARSANSVFESLGEQEQGIARRIFLGLVKLGEGTQDTRRSAEVSQLLSHKDDPDLARKVLSRFSSKEVRFITLSRKQHPTEGNGDRIIAELTHEALVEHWQRLRSWLDGCRSDVRFRRRLDDAARRWNELGRPDGSLWRSPELDMLRQRRSRLDDDLSVLEKEFSDAAERYDRELKMKRIQQMELERQQRQSEFKRQRKELRRLRVAAAIFSMLATGLASSLYWAFSEKYEADRLAVSEQVARKQAEAAVDREKEQRTRAELVAYNLTLRDVQQEIGSNAGKVLRMLEDTDRCPTHLREFAWQYLYSTARSYKSRWSHSASLECVRFSPNGARFAAASHDGKILIWLPGDPNPQVINAHADQARTIVFLGNDLIASAGFDGKVAVWNIGNGKEVSSYRHQHKPAIHSVAYSSSTGLIASVAKNGGGELVVWNPQTEKVVLRHFEENQRYMSVAFSEDGKKLFVGVARGIHIWDISQKKVEKKLPHSDWVWSLAVSGNTLASASFDGSVKLWDLDKETLRCQFSESASGRRFWQLGVSFLKDGSLVTCSASGKVTVWDIETQKAKFVLEGHSDDVNSITCHPDGTMLASCSLDKSIMLWDLSQKKRRNFSRHAGFAAAPLKDNSFAVLRPDARVITIDASDGKQDEIASAIPAARAFAISGDNTMLVSTDGQRIQLLDIKKSRLLWDSSLEESEMSILNIGFHPSQNEIICSDNLNVCILSLETGKEIRNAEADWNEGFDVSPNGHHLAIAGNPAILDYDSLKSITNFEGHTNRVNSVSFSKDGRYLASASDDRTARVWDVSSGHEVCVLLGNTAEVSAVAFSPGGESVVSGNRKGVVKVWNSQFGFELISLNGPTRPIRDLFFSESGNHVIASCSDGYVWVWSAFDDLQLEREQGFVPVVLGSSSEH